MILRKAETSDIAKMYKLEQELFSEENYPLSKSSLRYHQKNNLIYLAQVEEEIVGYILVLVRRRVAKVYSLGVSVAFRGQHISLELFKLTCMELLSMGFKELVLEVRTDNKAAIALYEKLGFRVQKVLKSFYLDGCDAYLMSKEL